MNDDKIFLTRALEIAKAGIPLGRGPFGALVTREGKILAESGNKVVLLKDPTAHAEILAIREAAALLKTHDLTGCVLYTSCEPCPMCLGAIYWSGIKKVVYASDRKDAANAGFNDSFIYSEISLEPSERNIEFHQKKIAAANEVFKRWEESEEKIRY